jgi:hypothetical protein
MPKGPTNTMKVAFYCYKCYTYKPLVYTNGYCVRCYEAEATGWPDEIPYLVADTEEHQVS